MATIEQLENALRNADAAGDVDAAKQLAGAIIELRRVSPPPAPQQEEGGILNRISAGVQGAASSLTFGLDDEIAAGLGAVGGMLPGGHGKGYSQLKAEINAENDRNTEQYPMTNLAGQAAGAIGGSAGLAARGFSMGANALKAGGGLGRVAAGSAVDGAWMGAAAGAGNGEGLDGRTGGAIMGGLIGTGVGAAAPLATAGIAAVGKPLVAPIAARAFPDRFAATHIGNTLRRSGQSVDDVVAALTSAADDAQPMFNVADALGHAGQRQLSAVVRTPNDARQGAVDTLMNRQSGQKERLSSFLADGFDAPDTAAQRGKALEAARDAEANVLYGKARSSAGAVDVSPVLAEIDATLSPGVSGLARPQDRIAPDTIEGALARVRSMISDGRSNLSDFNSLFRVKLDLDDMIKRSEAQGAGNRAHALSRVHRLVDDALAGASPEYATARDAFARGSRRMEAVGEGTAAASGRRRAADTIPAFDAMTPEEQAAFRAGYVDPLIARVESPTVLPSTNAARSVMSEKTGQEFPAFAAPGRADQLGNRIAREQRMFETSQAALGGSKTADNLADQTELANFDPSILAAFGRGDIWGGLTKVAGGALAQAKGMPSSVVERLAKTLLETDPEAARRMLTQGEQRSAKSDQVRALTNLLLTTLGSSSAGRLAAP